MQANKLLPIGALALAFAIGPAEAAPAPTTSPLGKSEASATPKSSGGIVVTIITDAAGARPHGLGSAPAS